jgi:hypothetical protein
MIHPHPENQDDILMSDDESDNNAKKEDPHKIRPFFRGGSGTSPYTKFVVVPLAIGSVLFEIIGKKQETLLFNLVLF